MTQLLTLITENSGNQQKMLWPRYQSIFLQLRVLLILRNDHHLSSTDTAPRVDPEVIGPRLCFMSQQGRGDNTENVNSERESWERVVTPPIPYARIAAVTQKNPNPEFGATQSRNQG